MGDHSFVQVLHSEASQKCPILRGSPCIIRRWTFLPAVGEGFHEIYVSPTSGTAPMD